MLLILEIILTIFAWRKGWKWLALLPVGIGFTLGLIIGFATGVTGGNVNDIKPLAFVLDIIVFIVLIIMNVKGPKTTELPQTPIK